MAAPALNRYVVPVAVLVLIALFSLQRSGTARVARVFAPIMVIWFLTLSRRWASCKIVQVPEVIQALNPYYAVEFFVENGRLGFFVLASVSARRDRRRSAVRRYGAFWQAARFVAPGSRSCCRP